MQNNEVIVLGRLIPDSGKIHQNQEVYDSIGIMCTLKAVHYKDPPKTLQYILKEKSKPIQHGYIEHGSGQHQSNTVWNIDYICPTVTTLVKGGTQQIKILVKQ